MAQWPATLHQCPMIGWSEQPMNNVIEFDADVGAPRRRRRSTLAGYQVSVTYKLTKAQLSTFWSFWENTIFDGVSKFDWPHPRYDGALREAYIMDAPKIDQQTNNMYVLSLSLRVF